MSLLIMAYALQILMFIGLVCGIIQVATGAVYIKPLRLVFGGFNIYIAKYMIGELSIAIAELSAKI